jgi:CheY-like chemotaxis protein/HPt (histidine-containing phosphotransfer) domain-containing protein
MMGLLLSEKGYNYDTASNGIEAINAVKAQSYSLVLMDIQMPLMDGFEATSKIREWEANNQHTPIVALTAMLLEDEIQKCLSVVMDDCIAKPFNTELLFQVIEAHVSKSRQTLLTDELHHSLMADKLELLDIREALPRFGRDLEVYREFLNEFLDNLPQRVDQFKEAFLSGDYKELADSAHNLKGISASIGAKQLAYLSQKLDKNSKDRDPSIIQPALEEIEKHAQVLREKAIEILSHFEG